MTIRIRVIRYCERPHILPASKIFVREPYFCYSVVCIWETQGWFMFRGSRSTGSRRGTLKDSAQTKFDLGI
jgi:hypothetical protein